MIKAKYYWWLLPLLTCLLTACSDDDDYYYPSVKLEFLTAFSGTSGDLKSVLTDDGKTYAVVEDATKTNIAVNTSIRIVSNYGMLTSADGTEGVKLYAALNALAPKPVPADQFKDGVKKHPADILGIWMGLDYLNITLSVKAQNGKHLFGFIEDKVTEDKGSRIREVYLTLYHDANGDVQAYTKRSYLSVPLRQYAVEGIDKIRVHFSLHTYSGEVKTYSFDYTPSNK